MQHVREEDDMKYQHVREEDDCDIHLTEEDDLKNMLERKKT